MMPTNAETTTTPRAAFYPLDTAERVSTPQSRLRRQALKSIAGALIIGAGAVFGWTKYLFPPRLKAVPPAGTPIGQIADFTPGAPPALLPTADQAKYSVRSIGGGQFVVLSAICTHQGCSVGWDAKAAQFLCPCHAGRYDTSGKVVDGPPPRPLPALPYHVHNGTLFLDV